MMRFCRSRRDGARCTRPLDHPGLHRHRAIMWSDLAADPAGCPGTGERGAPAAPLDDGYPHGRALCSTCGRFIGLDPRGRLLHHDTSDADESDGEVARRREWFNAHGW